MAIDDGLRSIIHRHLPQVHWQAVESGALGTGTPDTNGCFQGVEVWVECKATSAWSVSFRPGQIGWAERRTRAGGRVFLMTRRRTTAGPRKGAAVDELWIHRAGDMRHVKIGGLDGAPPPLLRVDGGPGRWDWDRVRHLLFVVDSRSQDPGTQHD